VSCSANQFLTQYGTGCGQCKNIKCPPSTYRVPGSDCTWQTKGYKCAPQPTVRTDADFKTATQAWCNDAASAEQKYGHISDWDTSAVTDMAEAFLNCNDFNEPIGNWETGQVTNMRFMFYSARAFNQPIGDWQTGQVTSMTHMFAYASAFNQPIGNWQIGKVTNVYAMFSGTALSGCNAHAAGAFEARGAKPPTDWRKEPCASAPADKFAQCPYWKQAHCTQGPWRFWMAANCATTCNTV